MMAVYQRQSDTNAYCGVTDTRMHYKRPTVPDPPPTVEGCWVANPTGCPNVPSHGTANSYQWYDPTAGGGRPAACEQRQRDVNAYCGVADARMQYNPGKGRTIEHVFWHAKPTAIILKTDESIHWLCTPQYAIFSSGTCRN